MHCRQAAAALAFFWSVTAMAAPPQTAPAEAPAKQGLPPVLVEILGLVDNDGVKAAVGHPVQRIQQEPWVFVAEIAGQFSLTLDVFQDGQAGFLCQVVT